jgi:hypothetical protein
VLILLMQLMSGFILGKLIKKPVLAYLICLPLGVVVELVFIELVGHGIPDVLAVISGLLYAPLVALGVYLCYRRARRTHFAAGTTD